MLKFTKGCTIQLEITADENIATWKIKAKLYDINSNSISLATANADGSDDEIEKTLIASQSKFVIKVPYATTKNWEDDGYLEIKVDTGNDIGGADEILLAYKARVKFEDSELDWDLE